MPKLHLTIATLVAITLALPAAAAPTLTQGQASAQHSLMEYGYRNVDVTKLNASQLAQIHYLASSSFGVGRVRGQIGAVLRQSNIWNQSRLRYK